MNTLKKPGKRKHIPLKEDVFDHLDSVYRSARRSKNYSIALKALELCLKAKNTLGKINNPLLHLQDLSDTELKEMLKMVEDKNDEDSPL